MKIEQALVAAGDIVLSARAGEYGTDSAVPIHNRIAQLWSGILDTEVKAHEVALCMAALKLVRCQVNPGKDDSWIDGIGYLAIGAECVDNVG